MEKSSQFDMNTDDRTNIKRMCKSIENKTSFQSDIISSHLIDATFTNSSSLSISDTSLDRLKMSYYAPNIYRTPTFFKVKVHSEEKLLIGVCNIDKT
jgi:hypothetical protein